MILAGVIAIVLLHFQYRRSCNNILCFHERFTIALALVLVTEAVQL